MVELQSKYTRVCFLALTTFFILAGLVRFSDEVKAQTKLPRPDISWTYDRIIKMAQQQLKQAKSLAKSPHDPILIAPLEMLAATYETKGDYGSAETYYQKALRIHEAGLLANPGQSASNAVFSLTKLGMMLHERGRTHEAEPYVKRALHLRDKDQTPQRVSLPDLLNNLAVIYQDQGRYTESEPLLKRALDLRKKENDPLKLALTYNNLAELYVSMDRLAVAAPFHRQALKIRQSIMPNGSETAISLNNLAGVLHYQKRYKKAEPYYHQALKIWKDNFGDRHPYVAIVRNNLAELYRQQKRYAEAERLNMRVLEVRQDVLGPSHPQVASTLSNIAKLYISQGRYKEAEPFARKSFAIDDKTQKPGHHFIRKGLTRLAEIYAHLKRPEQVKVFQRRLDALPPAGTKYLPVFYVTNRIKQAKNRTFSFGGKAAPKLTYGRATVVVPDTEIKGQAIRRAKANGLLDKATGKLTKAAELKVLKLESYKDPAKFASAALHAMQLAGQFKDQALIFIHGYNVSFDEAMLRAAQISFDLEFDGLLLPFSWPSQGVLAAYEEDQKKVAGAASKLVSMLKDLAEKMPGKKVHFIAHSMGNRVLLRALEQLSREEKSWRQVFAKVKLGEIIWAHPDVGQNDFAKAVKQLAARGAPMTLYSTKDDWALWASKLLHGSDRAGAKLLTVPGVDTIDITGLKAVDRAWFEFGLNHNVFVRNPALFGEITRLLLAGQRPVHHRSPEFRQVKAKSKKFWRYRRFETGRK